MTHSYVSHDSFICVTWLIHMCDMTHSYATWPISHTHTHEQVFDTAEIEMSASNYVASFQKFPHTHIQDSFICVPWLIHMCAMTHVASFQKFPHTRIQDSFTCVPWLILLYVCMSASNHVASFQKLSSCWGISIVVRGWCGREWLGGTARGPPSHSLPHVWCQVVEGFLFKDKSPFDFFFQNSCKKVNPNERWGAGVETQKNVLGVFGGWGWVPFNETYASSLSTIYDGA